MTSVTCTTANRNFAVHNMLITREVLKMASRSGICREVDEVREERFRRECNTLRREKTNKDTQGL